MTDPYRVLGVAPTASEDEIKKAYRKLSRLYHPDSNMNKSELEKKAAEEKFKAVQAAYEDIIDGKVDPRNYRSSSSAGSSSRSSYGRSYQGYGAGGTSYSGYRRDTSSNYGEPDSYLDAVADLISNGRLHEARNLLDTLDPSQRKAKWYYYSALTFERLGNRTQAIYHARAAASMEPSNSQYSVLYDYLTGGPFTRSTQDSAANYTGWYNDRRNTYGYGSTNATACCNTCVNLYFCASCLGC